MRKYCCEMCEDTDRKEKEFGKSNPKDRRKSTSETKKKGQAFSLSVADVYQNKKWYRG